MSGHIPQGRSHLLRVLPPPLPLVCVVGCDGQVPNGGVEPHVEHLGGTYVSSTTWHQSSATSWVPPPSTHLVTEAIQGHRCAPRQVPCDAAWTQPIPEPGACDEAGISCPVPCGP